MKFSLGPFSKGRRVPAAHKQGADRSGSGDFAGVKGVEPPFKKVCEAKKSQEKEQSDFFRTSFSK
ncbi:hypothetical protein B5F35_12265 [Anaeromassilibacillus sp. An200]|nr:hypothetical protein B5F35_12265 [Anaeromassilibacillus sp. An200]